jgi:23S rRNA (uracil1939-C5)-methyltransferase
MPRTGANPARGIFFQPPGTKEMAQLTDLTTDSLVELQIDSVAHGGDGVGRLSGLVFFVTGAFPGDRVRARVTHKGRRAVWCSLEEIMESGPCRALTGISDTLACASSCLWHDFLYPAQAEWKCRIVEDNLKRIGGLSAEIKWLEDPQLRTGYRTRAVFHGDGKVLGCYARRTREIKTATPCPSNHQRLLHAFQSLQSAGIYGDVQITVNPEGDEVLVHLQKDSPEARLRFPLVNTGDDKKRHHFVFDGVPVVNNSFSQASLLLNRILRKKVDTCIAGAGSLLDLYCGSGNFSLHYCDSAKVLGVDSNVHAIRAAQKHAPGSYECGTETLTKKLIQESVWDVILLDPPRTGAQQLIHCLKEARAKRIVYISCDPATLARDLKILSSSMRWHLKEVTAIDMFPGTPHVETVTLLETD